MIRPARFVTVAVWAALGTILPATVAAQGTGSVTGTVTDATTGAPLRGAQVLLAGTGRGAVSDERGRYLILRVPTDVHPVRVVRLGYATQEREVEVRDGVPTRVDFALTVSAVSLDEIVVTGTGGEVERRKVGASVSSVPVAQLIEDVPLESFGHALQARIPGVRSVGTTGGVGAGRDLRIRGNTSFSLSQRPVVYVDGIRIDTNQREWAGSSVEAGTCCSFSGGAGEDRLHDLNPEEIERVEVLKGAAAATLYGSEASSGVIQIFTRAGRSNSPPEFTLRTGIGFNRHRANFPTRLFPEFTNPSSGLAARDVNEGLIENGLVNTWDLTVRGGGEEVTYFAAGGFGYEEGSIQPNWMKRGNARVNLRWAASETWAFSVNTAYSRNRILALQSGNNWLAQLWALMGNPRGATEERPYGERPGFPSVKDIKEVEAFSDASRWTGGLTVTHEPSSAFRSRLSLGIDQVDEQKSRVLPFGRSYVYLPGVGEKNLGYRTARNVTAEYLGTATFGLRRDLTSQLSFGAQGFWESESLLMSIGRGFAGPGVTSLRGAAETSGDEAFEETINLGLFVQDRFSWREGVFATLGLRVDGNSAFGDDYAWKAYPKADVAWDVAESGILPEVISGLRLRASIGQAGMFPGAFDHFRTYEPTPVLDDDPGVAPFNPGNENLKPETTTEIEVGVDAAFLDDRLGVGFTAFRADTRDALLYVPLAPSRGFAQEALQNVGHIRNTGWELSLTAVPVHAESVRWSTTLNLDGIDNEVVELGPKAGWFKHHVGLDELGNEVVDSTRALGFYWEGFPTNFWRQRAVTGYDRDTNTHTLSNYPAYLGSTLPTFNLSWGNTLTIGPFRLFGLLSAEKGAWLANWDRTVATRLYATGDEYLGLFDFNTLDADGNPTPTLAADSLRDLSRKQIFVDKRDHVRLREVSIAWDVDPDLTDRLGLGSTTLSLSGFNLHWWDDCKCTDPSANYRGGDSFSFTSPLTTPQPRRFLFSVRTRF